MTTLSQTFSAVSIFLNDIMRLRGGRANGLTMFRIHQKRKQNIAHTDNNQTISPIKPILSVLEPQGAKGFICVAKPWRPDRLPKHSRTTFLNLVSQFMRLAAGFLKKLRELISYTLEFILLADEPESKPHLQLPRVQYCVRPKMFHNIFLKEAIRFEGLLYVVM